ncbi:MAG TPA: hypothetical protein VMW92_04230 [Candidatus Heimdallarchaeota archaeon]|nr:hypothetical protein [Candidatus Heimdallarchaeota archaeon]
MGRRTTILSLQVRSSVTRIDIENAGQQRVEIFAESSDVFFFKAVDAQITFAKDEKGKVTGSSSMTPAEKLPREKLNSLPV